MKRRGLAEHERRRTSTRESRGPTDLPLWRPPAATADDASLDARRPLAQRLGNWAQLLVLGLVLTLVLAVLPGAQVRPAVSAPAPATHGAPKVTAPVHNAPVGTVSKSSAGGAIPTAVAPAAKAVPAAAAAPTSPASLRVPIRRGNTLWAFARDYGTTVAALQALNGMGTSTVIYTGGTLLVPAPHHGSAPTPLLTDGAAAPAGQGAAAAVAYAKAQLGKPYLYGGTGPDSFDCSGLVLRAWQAAGVELPRTTYEQVNAGVRIGRGQLQPGDLVFSNGIGHVQLYLGSGQVIEAPHTGASVRIVPLPGADAVDAYIHVAAPAPAAQMTPASNTTKSVKQKSKSTSTAAKGTTSGTGSTSSGTSGSGTTAGSGTTTTSGTSSSTGTRGFQGIYAFSGGNTSTLATDPDVAGRSLVYYWAQIEPQQGTYHWDLIDKDIAPWAAAGKKVILRISTSGWAAWDKAADSAHGTPAWVYAQGVKYVTETDHAVLPQYWNPVFINDYSAFLKAFAARYDGNAHVELIDASVGIGGETKPDSEKNPAMLGLWQKIGYSDPIWWTAVQQILTAYSQAFHKTPVAVMPDKTFLGGTAGYNEAKTVAFAVSKNMWLQDNGLIPGRTLPSTWASSTLVSEQRGPTSQTGDTLSADLQAALSDHATLILVFTSDLTSANRAVIHQVASRATTTSSSSGGTATGTTSDSGTATDTSGTGSASDTGTGTGTGTTTTSSSVKKTTKKNAKKSKHKSKKHKKHKKHKKTIKQKSKKKSTKKSKKKATTSTVKSVVKKPKSTTSTPTTTDSTSDTSSTAGSTQ